LTKRKQGRKQNVATLGKKRRGGRLRAALSHNRRERGSNKSAQNGVGPGRVSEPRFNSNQEHARIEDQKNTRVWGDRFLIHIGSRTGKKQIAVGKTATEPNGGGRPVTGNKKTDQKKRGGEEG